MVSLSRGLCLGASLLAVAFTGGGQGLAWAGEESRPPAAGNESYQEASGKPVEDERELPNFRWISVEDGIELHVVVKPSQPRWVRVIGEESQVKQVLTEVDSNSHLFVRLAEGQVGGSSSIPPRVEITIPELRALQRTGGGRVDLSGNITTSLIFESLGGGEVTIRGLNSSLLIIDAEDGSDITLEGSVEDCSVSLMESGQVHGRQFVAKQATLSIGQKSVVSVMVRDLLTVSVYENSSVEVIGSPAILFEYVEDGSTLTFE